MIIDKLVFLPLNYSLIINSVIVKNGFSPFSLHLDDTSGLFPLTLVLSEFPVYCVSYF